MNNSFARSVSVESFFSSMNEANLVYVLVASGKNCSLWPSISSTIKS
jgi:hypothetical protein